VSASAGQLTRDYLLPGRKKTEFKMEYIREAWPDTITSAQAQRLALIQDMSQGYEKLLAISKDLQEQSGRQLEQLKKLNDEINAGRLGEENLVQYLTFESKCADTLSKVLDTLVKRSIELSCKSQSL
jgi:allophanate hydrolase subunit 1